MLSNTTNKVIARKYFKHDGYHNVKCISKSSGIEITEARGDDDVFPSSSFLGEYVSLEGCEFQTQDATNGLTLFSDEPSPKVDSPSTIGILQGGIWSPYNNLEAQPTKGLGAPK